MRIAMISTPFLSVPPKTYGGTELVVYELVEGLCARGHHVTLFATGDAHTAAELRALYPEAQWPPGTLTDLNHVAWAAQQARAGGFDVVHAHSAVALAASRFLPDTPLVYTVHHEREEQLSAFYAYYPNVWYAMISADQRAREIPLVHSEVIHHGLDPDRYEWTTMPGTYVAFVGRLARVKGPHTAIDVARRAGVEIRVAGEIHGVDRDFGKREILPRLVQPHVDYLGLIDVRAKVSLLRDARALLAPIDWNEPFGLILIEAMLSGCPVIAFPRGSIPELVESGVTGFLAGSAADMVELLRPGSALEAFDRGRCRRRAVERFSRSRLVADYEAFYLRAIHQTAGGPHVQIA